MRKKYLRRSPVLQKIGDESEQFTEEQVAEPSPPTLDPASIAARILLDKALADCGLSLVQAAQNGIVTVVVVPSPEWTAVVLDDWTTRARADKPYKELFGQIWKGEWLSWAPSEMPRLGRIEEDAGKFARAIAAGRHCVGITPDETWLPGDFVDAADHRLVLGQLRGEDIGVIAEELCGDAPTLLPPDTFTALISPKHLRLARRVGQSADAYVDKLVGLLEKIQRPAPIVAASPRSAPTLDRLHGMDEAVQWGLAVARDLQAYREGKLPWSAVDSGCLLAGPPGCGKTLFARAFAATCCVELISGSYGIWHSSGSAHQGHFLQAMRKAFSDARAKAPAVLFIDEIDSFPNRATLKHDWADYEIQIVNALLTEMDGVGGREGVILIGACNFPQKLDPALIRSGRLDRHIVIGLPDRAGLARILREHLGSDLTRADLTGAAMAAAGSTGADCERFVRGARRRARLENRDLVMEDLMSEIGGPPLNPAEVWATAVHEAGHAVALCSYQPGILETVALRDAGDSNGRTVGRYTPPLEGTALEGDRFLRFLLSGRAAEEEICGFQRIAARHSDLIAATIPI